MAKEIRITSVRNAHGVKVKRCCASCQHKCIETDGTRVCAQMKIKVEQRFKCKQWLMSDGWCALKVPQKSLFSNRVEGVSGGNVIRM